MSKRSDRVLSPAPRDPRVNHGRGVRLSRLTDATEPLWQRGPARPPRNGHIGHEPSGCFAPVWVVLILEHHICHLQKGNID
ncbi:hypothetical protein EYF80_013808 [Liparis tanakae]|uniref:Uncharacterized protein n=1 Tax=Liparis tanakae TaxID=230148 RepID=A0A4Z2IEN3_9TELE|nr:hypothetical protein EYF80_013808 [Liparis tanakae]